MESLGESKYGTSQYARSFLLLFYMKCNSALESGFKFPLYKKGNGKAGFSTLSYHEASIVKRKDSISKHEVLFSCLFNQ